MLTGDQVLAHLAGDYFLQSDWQALNKKDRIWPCLVHCMLYTLPFLLLTRSPLALLIIGGSHFAIDHWGLTRYLMWIKNWIGPRPKPWKECEATGYDPSRPIWLTVWLLIIADNSLHVAINAVVLKYL